MKKLAPSLSPYLMLLIPVLLFISLSFAISKEVNKTSVSSASYSLTEKGTQMVIEAGRKSLIQMLLK